MISYSFISKDFRPTSTSPDLTYGLAINGLFYSTVASTGNSYYQLENYSGNNSLRLPAFNDSGILTFSTPKAANRLFMISTSGSGTLIVEVMVTFTDTTTQAFTGISISGWYNGTNSVQRLGRLTTYIF